LKIKLYLIYILALAVMAGTLSVRSDLSVKAYEPLPFNDIQDSFARNEIVDLYNRQIIGGVGERSFAPERAITRAEFTAMLLRLFDLQPTHSAVPAFNDVSVSAWYYGPVHALVNLGIVSGTSPNTFEPSKPIARQEAAVLMAKAAKLSMPSSGSVSIAYKDAAKVSAWAQSAVAAADRDGLMRGSAGWFRPLDPISREEAAAVFHRLLMKEGEVPNSGAKKANEIQLGWIYNQTREQLEKSLEGSPINTLSPRWFTLKATAPNLLAVKADAEFVNWAHGRGKQVWAMVANGFDRELTHQMLSAQASREKVIAELVNSVRQYHLDGLNIDFENLDTADRKLFTLFIDTLARELEKSGSDAVLSVCVPPDSNIEWSEPYDYKSLGKSADYVVVMGYDEHWSGSPKAGSVSSLPWLSTHLKKLTDYMPGSKLIAGLPLYTRDWSEQGDKTVSEDLLLPQQDALFASVKPVFWWNKWEGQYVAEYWKDGIRHRIWMEDGRSLAQKLRAGAEIGAAGFAYWHIGGGTEEVWETIRNAVQYYDFE
jgi:spore germination protein